MANISFTLKYWLQNGPQDKGLLDTREMNDIPTDTAFLEMLDILNEQLIDEGHEPFVFDHDFREEYQTPEGEAQRDDENFFYVGCWEYKNDEETAPELIKEPLEYEAIKVQTRNYKN